MLYTLNINGYQKRLFAMKYLLISYKETTQMIKLLNKINILCVFSVSILINVIYFSFCSAHMTKS